MDRYLTSIPCQDCWRFSDLDTRCVYRCTANVSWTTIPSAWPEARVRLEYPELAAVADAAPYYEECARAARARAAQWEGVKIPL